MLSKPYLSKQGVNIPEKRRDTNLELFRVITMLLIVAHHYVVNSDLMPLISSSPTTPNSTFLLLLGAWGKTGINCFVMITGYFMCKSTLTAKRFFKLLLQVTFYRIVVNGLFWISGYEELTLGTLIRLVPFRTIERGFFNTYLLFMLFIPFINILIHNLSQRQHFYLLLLVSFMYIFLGTFRTVLSVTMNYTSWFIVLYLLASYVRMYPHPSKRFSSPRFWGCMAAAGILAGAASIIASARFGKSVYFFVQDCNTFLAVFIGFSAFMFFKNIRVPYSRFINALASTCFGVLLIHANSNTMRQWLWKDTLNNVAFFSSKWLPLHALGSVILIFLICACADYMRLCWVEKPLFKAWDRYWPKVMKAYKRVEAKAFRKLGIPD